MTNSEIIPSLLATTEAEYQQKIENIIQSESFLDGWVQIDIVDGKFADNKTVGLDILAKHPINIKKEAQLMVTDPENWIDELVKLGVKRITFPIETGKTVELINKIKSLGVEVGISLNPETPVAKVAPFIDTIDLVLLMSVNPGFGGQEFIAGTLDKVKEVLRLRSEHNKFLIEVDGGIDGEVARKLVEAGVDNLVIGSHLVNGNITENLEKIWESVNF